MNDNKDKRLVRASVDDCFSALHGSPRLTRQVLLRAQEKETAPKKRVPAALILAAVMTLIAAVSLAAALYPKTAERYAAAYGTSYGAFLSSGDVADMNETRVFGDVRCTLTDVIYADGTLYGTVVMAPAEGKNVVLLPALSAEEDGADALSPDGQNTYRQLAAQKNAALWAVSCIPEGYAAEDRVLSGTAGCFDTALPDGSVAATFELHGWEGGIARDQAYTLLLTVRCTPVGESGHPAAEASPALWQVTVLPETKTQAADEAANAPAGSISDASAPDAGATSAVSPDGLSIVTPAGYNGTLKTYALTSLRLSQTVDPAWFNTTGIRTHEGDSYVFNDDDVLQLSDDLVWYASNAGTEEVTHLSANGKAFSETLPRSEGAQQAFSLIAWLYAGDKAEKADEALSFVTLRQAQMAAEALLGKMGIADVQCVWRYAADTATLETLNAAQNRQIAAGELLNCNPWLDPFTAADEGYYLVYRAAVDGVPAGDAYADIVLYVTCDGVRSAAIRAPFSRGAAIAENTLLSAQDALNAAVDRAGKSRYPDLANGLRQPDQVELIYTVQNQARLIPAWRITGWDTAEHSEITVLVNAVDGTVLDAPWL